MVPFVGMVLKLALGPVMDVVGKYIDRQADKDKLKAEVEQALIAAGVSDGRALSASRSKPAICL